MKIKKMEVFTLDIPLSYPMVFTFFGDVISLNVGREVAVKVTGEDGTVGYGLTAPVPFYHGQTQGMMVAAIKHLHPFVEGQDAFNIEHIHDVMDWALRGSGPAKCAIDLAIYDMLGKIVGKPAYALLGGKRRDDFVTTFTLTSGRDKIWNAKEAAQEAKRLYDMGFRGYEIHVGTAPGKGFHEDVERIGAIREAVGPDVDIDVDAHRNWTVKEAILGIRELEKYNCFIEQPVDGLDAMAEVRRNVGASIIADESCQTAEDGAEIIRRGSADAVCIKPIKAGGLYKAKKLAILAESFGLLTRVDGIPGEGKLSNTASAHIVMTLKYPIVCGVMQHARLEKDLVVDGGLEFADGKVTVPDRPGLGVEVDEKMLVPA